MTRPNNRSNPTKERAAVSVARLRNGVVILDAANDSYSALYMPGAGSDPRPGLNPTAIDALTDLGLVEQASCAPPVSGLDRERPWEDLALDELSPIGGKDVGRFLVALLRTSLAFQFRSFERLLSSQQRAQAPAGAVVDYQAAVARFERMRLILPIPMQCLFRSHFLLTFLRAHGLAANWMFGVSLFPFHAHCWLGVGNRLLGERSERTQDLVLIRVITNALDNAA